MWRRKGSTFKTSTSSSATWSVLWLRSRLHPEEPLPNDNGWQRGELNTLSDRKDVCFPQAEPLAVTGQVRRGRRPEASRMPRPMMVLTGERQPGQQVSPIREQNVARGS